MSREKNYMASLLDLDYTLIFCKFFLTKLVSMEAIEERVTATIKGVVVEKEALEIMEGKEGIQ